MNNDTSEITKLTERISKDPKSKLFVPLAEEYKKAGDIEMAVHVLTEGLKNNPGYVTARSFLGKLLIDQGDLAGAQKEFEEVIKAIPDNLMAQRKLGDIHALQSRTAEALKHYKAVLGLNPKDTDTAKLVAEAEAGRDIKKLVPGPKVTTAKQEPEVRQQQIRAAAPSGTSAAPPAMVPAPASATVTSYAAEEEAEEVLVVEPLEPSAPSAVATGDQAAAAAGFDFLSQNETPEQRGDQAAGLDPFAFGEAQEETAPFPTGSATENAETAENIFAEMPPPGVEGTDLIEPFALAAEEAAVIEETDMPPALEDPFTGHVAPAEAGYPVGGSGEGAGAFEEKSPSLELGEPFGVSEQIIPSVEEPIEAFVVDEPLGSLEHAAEVPGDTDFVVGELLAEEPATQAPHEESVSDFITAEIVEEPGKQGDDFTTDTLAELYISQGFFEKAIDIYERMLADHPNSEGLKDKLIHVRSMAAVSGEGESLSSGSEAEDAEAQDRPDTAARADAFAAPGVTQPRLDDWELPAANAIPASTDDAPSRPAAHAKHFDLGFEPREYVPPDAVPRKRESEIGKQGTPKGLEPEQASAIEQAAPINRKETVARLENWLKNIIKES